MKTVTEMAREAGWTGYDSQDERFERFAELIRADEREQIAQMIEGAPALVEFAQNEHGGCLICGFTPKIAAQSVRGKWGRHD